MGRGTLAALLFDLKNLLIDLCRDKVHLNLTSRGAGEGFHDGVFAHLGALPAPDEDTHFFNLALSGFARGWDSPHTLVLLVLPPMVAIKKRATGETPGLPKGLAAPLNPAPASFR
jgi:hypothetical protein